MNNAPVGLGLQNLAFDTAFRIGQAMKSQAKHNKITINTQQKHK